jgi:hypothetical protein
MSGEAFAAVNDDPMRGCDNRQQHIDECGRDEDPMNQEELGPRGVDRRAGTRRPGLGHRGSCGWVEPMKRTGESMATHEDPGRSRRSSTTPQSEVTCAHKRADGQPGSPTFTNWTAWP